MKRDANDGKDASRAARERFSELVLPYLAEAYGLARLMTGSRADAEDVVQEACLRAFRVIDRAVVTSPRSWVLTIVRNAACTWLARNRPADIVAVDDLEAVEQKQSGSGACNEQSPEASAIARAESETLRAAIEALPAAYREVLVLRDIEGLSYRELGAVLDVPVGTVMSRLARARTRLIAAIGETAA